MSRKPKVYPSDPRTQTHRTAPVHDAMGPQYLERAQRVGMHGACGDWPEAYVLAQTLGRRIDVYWPCEDAVLLGRYVLNGSAPGRTRWCLLREHDSWTPLLGDVPDQETLHIETAMDYAATGPDGADALFAAIATLYLLSPMPRAWPATAEALRACAAASLAREGQLAYAARDATLMQMLALMAER